MAELPSDSRPIPDVYHAEIRGVTVIIQFAPDDGYYGIGLVHGQEVAFVGPFDGLQKSLGVLGHAIRDQGFWEEEA